MVKNLKREVFWDERLKYARIEELKKEGKKFQEWRFGGRKNKPHRWELEVL